MRLEAVTAVLRPRGKYEAADLGLALTRRHYKGVMKALLCLVIPLWGALAILLQNHPAWLIPLIWWLKPLYSRVMVFYLGNALFGDPPSGRAQRRAWPGLLTRGMLPALTWLRFSPSRSFTDPVAVLEGLRGKPYRSRSSLLLRHSGGAATGVTMMVLTLEQAILLGTSDIAFGFLPPHLMEDWQARIGSMTDFSGLFIVPAVVYWAAAAAYALAVLLVEPFYSGAGFGLYLNTRTELEGWDIELVFRRTGARLASVSPAPLTPPSLPPGPPALPATLLAVGALFAAGPAAEAAADVESRFPGVRAAGDTVRQVLAHPDFQEHTREISEWKWDHSLWSSSTPDFSWLDWMAHLPVVLLYTLGAGLLIWLGAWLWKNRENFHRAPSSPAAPRPGPRTVMGLDVAPDSLPDDIPAAARAAWLAGDREGALRLLYRGSLAWLAARGAPLRESDTEGDCLRHARALPEGPEREYFARLTGVWLSTAYAQSPPGESGAEDLFRNWPFSRASAVRLSPTAFAPAVLCCAGLFLFTGCSGHWEKTTKELGHRGEAARNPWLAAERFLRESGIPVEHMRGVARLPRFGGVLVVSSDTMTSAAAAEQVYRWVTSGGHLIHVVEGGQMHRNDWNTSWGVTGAPDADMLLKRLGARRTDEDREVGTVSDEIEIDGISHRNELEKIPLINLEGVTGQTPGILAGTLKKAALADLRVGAGHITLVSNGRFFRNRYIGRLEHAALLQALITRDGAPAEVLFAGGGRVTLLELLREYGWQAVLAAGLLLAAWLWRHTPRFGPARSAPPPSPATFLSHLEDSGAFLWRQKQFDSLLGGPRSAVMQAAARRFVSRDAPELVPLLAQRSGLSEERVNAALFEDAADAPDGRKTVRRMSDLQTIQQTL